MVQMIPGFAIRPHDICIKLLTDYAKLHLMIGSISKILSYFGIVGLLLFAFNNLIDYKTKIQNRKRVMI